MAHKRLTRAAVAPMVQKLLVVQGHKCAICQVPLQVGKKSKLRDSYRGLPCLDHSHDTGFVRGVLCNTCNVGDGRVRTMAVRHGFGKEGYLDWLIKLVAYLHTRDRLPPAYPYLHPEHQTDDEKRLAKNAKARKKRQSTK